MPPRLGEIIEDGPSRHRLRKGLILVARDGKREATSAEQQRIAARASQWLAGQAALSEYKVEADASHPALLSIVTPFATVYSPGHRDAFFQQLGQVLNAVLSAAESAGLFPIGAGVDPFVQPADGQHPALCADVHEIEVLDDLEINRIYNLFRQYLPELLAISAHSALYGGRLQKDLSSRMRLNPSSFTPPALTLFSSKQLDRLQRSMRKDYGLSDITQLDVNPIAPGAIALRFVDGQASLRFIRAQMILFQAIAIHGRALARQGSQTPTLHSRTVAENKALAIEAGPAAIFKPDRRREIRRARDWYQDRKATERASTALLEALYLQTVDYSPTILHALRSLKADYTELTPWLLGSELRKRGEACLVNYGEYQVRLYHVARTGWPAQLFTDLRRLIMDSAADLLCEYNEMKFPQLAQTIAAEWSGKLARREFIPRAAGHPSGQASTRHDSRDRQEKDR